MLLKCGFEGYNKTGGAYLGNEIPAHVAFHQKPWISPEFRVFPLLSRLKPKGR